MFRVNTTVAKNLARYKLSFSGCIGGYVGQVGRYKNRGFYFYENVLNLNDCFLKSEVISFCFSWFSSTDISVGFVGLIFQRIQTESPFIKV